MSGRDLVRIAWLFVHGRIVKGAFGAICKVCMQMQYVGASSEPKLERMAPVLSS